MSDDTELARAEDGSIIVLKKPEIRRDAEGRFERHGKAISKTAKTKNSNNLAGIKKPENIRDSNKGARLPLMIGTGKKGPGRPKGSPNKTSLALKEAILRAGEEVGNELSGDGLTGYLKTLARENSSAYAGLLGKVLPSTLAMPESNGGVREKVTFERVIVWPDGHREIEGVTPKQLPKPDDK